MKLSVVVDKNGNIVGYSQAGTSKTDDGIEFEHAPIAGPGQTLKEVDVDDETVKRPVDEVQKVIQKAL